MTFQSLPLVENCCSSHPIANFRRFQLEFEPDGTSALCNIVPPRIHLRNYVMKRTRHSLLIWSRTARSRCSAKNSHFRSCGHEIRLLSSYMHRQICYWSSQTMFLNWSDYLWTSTLNSFPSKTRYTGHVFKAPVEDWSFYDFPG
jgi:hypothetical protein